MDACHSTAPGKGLMPTHTRSTQRRCCPRIYPRLRSLRTRSCAGTPSREPLENIIAVIKIIVIITGHLQIARKAPFGPTGGPSKQPLPALHRPNAPKTPFSILWDRVIQYGKGVLA
jgi:hypothetical protein